MRKIDFAFFQNNVDPNDQVAFPYYFDGANKDDSSFKVMFIGNSITYHEIKKDIGWNKNCGMAASCLNKDYVHLVMKELAKTHKDISICVFNAGRWEVDYTNNKKFISIKDALKLYKPHLVIIRLGENFSKENLKNRIDPFPSFVKLIKECKQYTDDVYITSMFWEHNVLDKAIKRASLKTKAEYILINDLSKDDKNKATGKYKHQGICGHPGDIGMKKIAERILNSIKKNK